MSAHDDVPPGDAWRDFCDRLKAAGDTVAAAAGSASGPGLAEGHRHLSRLAVYALQWHVEFHDPAFPAFHRYDDDAVKWGGPNTDNHYLRAKIDPRHAYRVRFDARSLREVIVSTPEGEMQFDQYRVFEERRLADLEIDANGGVEIVLSAEPAPGNWMALHSEADHVLVRLYVSDWMEDAVPAVDIERIGSAGEAPPRLAPATLAARLDHAATWVERTIAYWPAFMERRRQAAPPNTLSPPTAVPGGAADILYGGGFWRLADGEALLIESEVPQADYWSFQLYSFPWFESLDVAHRPNSVNDRQAVLDPDGRLRVVLAAADPGLANWLDTEGRTEGMLSYRWVWASTSPVPDARVVRLDALADAVPADAVRVDAAARSAQLGARRAAVARRFRR